MKQYFFVALSMLFLATACEEENHGIIFTKPLAPLLDTSYIDNTIASQTFKTILLEDLTGVRCVNCPQAAQKAKELKQKMGDSLVVVGLYLKSLPNFTNGYQGQEDLRTDDAEAIAQAIGVPQGLPNGYVDRHRFGASAGLPINNWEPSINQRKGNTPIHLSLQKEIRSDSQVIIKSKIAYGEDMGSANHKLAIYITESGIQSTQAYTGGYDENYIHDHVLRGSVTPTMGILLTQSLEKGRVFEKDYEYKWNPNWNRLKSYAVAIVIDANTEEVLQAKEIKLYD